MLAIRLGRMRWSHLHNPTHNQNAQPSVLHVISAMAYPYILALVSQTETRRWSLCFLSFNHSSFLSFSSLFLFHFSFHLFSPSLAVLFCPLLRPHFLAALIYYYHLSLSVHVFSLPFWAHLFPHPLISPSLPSALL